MGNFSDWWHTKRVELRQRQAETNFHDLSRSTGKISPRVNHSKKVQRLQTKHTMRRERKSEQNMAENGRLLLDIDDKVHCRQSIYRRMQNAHVMLRMGQTSSARVRRRFQEQHGANV